MSAAKVRRRASASGAPQVVVTPVVVSDATAFAVVGLTDRQFRDFVRDAGVPHAKVGRRTVARVDRILEVLDRACGAAPRPQLSEDEIVELAARKGGAR